VFVIRRIWAKGRDVESGVKREDTGQTSIKSRAVDGSAPGSRKSSRASRIDKDANKDQLLSQVKYIHLFNILFTISYDHVMVLVTFRHRNSIH